jgi:hypothetical protein
MASAKDPWIDYLIISRLGGCYATPIIQFFQDGSAILQPHFHIISTSRLMSWTTFQPRGRSSTIEDFSKQYSRTLKNYSKMLQDYSNYYTRLQCARGLVGHTPRVPMQGRMMTDSN